MMLRQLFFFFSPRKALGFILLQILGTGFTPYLCYVLFRDGAGGGYDGKPGSWLRAAQRDIRTNRPGTDCSLPRPHPFDTHTPRPDRIGVFPSLACITSKIDVSTDQREAP